MENTKKVAIVTGALGGIGLASVYKLLENGYHVVGMGSSSADLPEKKEKIESCGENFTYVQGNVALAEDRENLVNTALTLHGRIDMLCNVAGVAPKVRRDILEMTEESYDYVMDINLRGTTFLTQAVANQMLKQDKINGIRGYIVNISSCSAYTSSTSRGEYCLSKAAESMLTTLFADRLSSEGILVNEICPGIIATGMTAAVKEKYDKLIAEGLVPLGRWGEPDDVAKVVMALCDGTMGYTTGASIRVDGGMHIRRL